MFDQNTGQALFRPRIGRPPKNLITNTGIPVSDKLYRQAMVSKERIQRMI